MQLVCIIVDEQADVAAFKDFKPEQESAAAPPVQQKQESKVETQSKPKSAAPSKSYPDHMKLTMPALSPTMSTGKITSWLKKPGDSVSAGDVVCEVETDKASVGYEVQEDGILAKILAPEGDKDISIGEPLAILAYDESDVAAFEDYTGEEVSSGGSAAQPEQKTSASSSSTQSNLNQPQSGDRVFISPLAKNTALSNGVSISDLAGKGSGPQGRVINSDVEAFLQAGGSVQQASTPASAPSQKQKPASKQPAPSNVDNPYEDIPLNNIRKITAARLLESKTTIPHYYMTVSIKMDELMAIRSELNKESQVKISVNDLLIKASALACRDVPEVNSQWNGEFIRKFENCDVSVAVATDNGLITPIVFSANTKGLSAIAAKTKELAGKARENKLKPDEFMGGTFTISNLGNFGIEHFCAVINPPQSCILAVGKTEKTVVFNEEDPVTPKLDIIVVILELLAS